MRTLARLSTLPLLVGALAAQCLDTSGGVPAGLVAVGGDPAHDEGLSPPIDMLLGAGGFPMVGAAGPLTHCVVDSNCVVYLTAGAAAVDRVLYGAFTVDDVRGTAGASPRVFACWADNQGPSAGWAVTFDTSVPGRFRVNWIDVQDWIGPPTFRCSVAGVSIGNAVGTGLETSVDLTSGPDSGALGLLFQQFDGVTVPAVVDRTVTLLPNGLGGYAATVTCEPAYHAAYGAGCYDIARESVYQFFPDAAVASAALQGNSMTLLPTSAGYVVTWNVGGAAGYVTPVAPTNFLRSDDGQNLLDLTLASLPALPVPGGSTTTLYVHDNGFISTTGPTNDGGAWNDPVFNDYTPSASFRNAPEAAFWSWHDFNPFDTAGGAIGWHYDPALTRLYITWQGVENWSVPTAANPSTIQFQFDLTSGQVDCVWLAVDTDVTTPFSSAHLVGFSPAGASSDPGSIVLATGLPVVTLADVRPLSLSAAPPPVNDGVTGTAVTYTIAHIPEFVPGSGVHIATLFLSVASLPGVDLGLLGAPGCDAHIASLDLNIGVAPSLMPTATAVVWFPPGPLLPPGADAWCQAVSLFDPAFPLPNGQNAFGLTTSNGVRSHVEAQ